MRETEKKDARTPTTSRVPVPLLPGRSLSTKKNQANPEEEILLENNENTEPNVLVEPAHMRESPSSNVMSTQVRKNVIMTPVSAGTITGRRLQRLSLHGVNPQATPAAAIVLGNSTSSPTPGTGGTVKFQRNTPSTSALKVPKLKLTPVCGTTGRDDDQARFLVDEFEHEPLKPIMMKSIT